MSKRRRSNEFTLETQLPPPTQSRKSNNPPPFITSLWDMVDAPETDGFISWTASGDSFQVHDPTQFQERLLPRYFKHRKFTSFIRQLNMYKFKRITTESGSWVWTHSHFCRGHPELLMEIRRRTADIAQNHIHSSQQSMMQIETSIDQHIEERVRELELSRSQLLADLQVGHRDQMRMRQQIETLQTQVNSILSVLLCQTQVPGDPSGVKVGQKLLLDSSMLSQIEEVSGNSTPNDNIGMDDTGAMNDVPSPTDGLLHRSDPDADPFSSLDMGLSLDSSSQKLPVNSSPFTADSPSLPPLQTQPILPPTPPAVPTPPSALNDIAMQMPSLNINDDEFDEMWQAPTPEPISELPQIPTLDRDDLPFTETVADSGSLRTLRVSDNDGIIVHNVQAVVHQLLESLAAAYKKQGKADVLPKLFNGFGCWFVNSSRKPAPSWLPSGTAKSEETDPWALMVFGLSEKT